MTPEQETKAEMLALLMTELDVSIWNGVVSLTNDQKGPRIIRVTNEDAESAWKVTDK
ncbi:hypothetical protein ACFQS3_02550 [Glycomyces mayteni]|uniref:Uncharacterized protein n=1 Tax=Glycomyces mayteni TaxID=543887 RepID=A0ABW2D5X6_9ACTN|nr:hypothetical protein GCM10025732_48080 [Glycomyces mayteni]